MIDVGMPVLLAVDAYTQVLVGSDTLQEAVTALAQSSLTSALTECSFWIHPIPEPIQ